jgi:hypothetical protein
MPIAMMMGAAITSETSVKVYQNTLATTQKAASHLHTAAVATSHLT